MKPQELCSRLWLRALCRCCSLRFGWRGTDWLHQFLYWTQGGPGEATQEMWLGARQGCVLDPWGQLFPFSFGEAAPEAKIKLGWDHIAARDRHVICSVTYLTKAAQIPHYGLVGGFFFLNKQHITFTSRTFWRTSCIPLLYDRKYPHLIQNSLRHGSAAFPNSE